MHPPESLSARRRGPSRGIAPKLSSRRAVERYFTSCRLHGQRWRRLIVGEHIAVQGDFGTVRSGEGGSSRSALALPVAFLRLPTLACADGKYSASISASAAFFVVLDRAPKEAAEVGGWPRSKCDVQEKVAQAALTATRCCSSYWSLPSSSAVRCVSWAELRAAPTSSLVAEAWSRALWLARSCLVVPRS